MSIIFEKMQPFKPIKIKHKDVVYWFDILNEEIFDNVVPNPNKITIKKMNKDLGWVKELLYENSGKIELGLLPEYSNIGLFLNILAHEMIHIWQILVLKDTGNHNKHFYSWKHKFKKHGLKLERCYRH